MKCAEFKELCAAYVLGSVEPAERDACDAHLAEAEHEGCHAALAGAAATVHTIPLALEPLRPRKELWDAIAQQIAPPSAMARRRRVWPVAVVAVACAAAALFLLYERDGLVQRAGDAERTLAGRTEELRKAEALRETCQTELAGLKGQLEAQKEAVALLTAPGTRLVALAPDPKDSVDHRAVVLFDAGQNRAAIVAHGLSVQAGKDYELWVIKGDVKKAAGLLRGDPSGGVAAVIDPKVLSDGVDAFAVTVEPSGGGTAPTGPIILVGVVSKA